MTGVAVLCPVGCADPSQERRQRRGLEGRPLAVGELMDQSTEPGTAEGAVRVVDRGECQALTGGHVGGRHGTQGATGDVGVVKGEAAAVAEPHALGQGESLFLREEVGDRVNDYEAEINSDLVGVMTHRRVGGELAGQRGVRTGNNWRPRRAAART